MVSILKGKIYRLALLVLIIDQFVKYMVMTNLSYENTFFLLPKFLYLTYVKNTGGAWSILSGNIIILLMVGIVSIGLLGYFIYQRKSFSVLETIYLGLIIGGILGNLIDRLFRNGVVDYLGFIFGNYYFPVFNIADIAIVCGAGLLIIDNLRRDTNGITGN